MEAHLLDYNGWQTKSCSEDKKTNKNPCVPLNSQSACEIELEGLECGSPSSCFTFPLCFWKILDISNKLATCRRIHFCLINRVLQEWVQKGCKYVFMHFRFHRHCSFLWVFGLKQGWQAQSWDKLKGFHVLNQDIKYIRNTSLLIYLFFHHWRVLEMSTEQIG